VAIGEAALMGAGVGAMALVGMLWLVRV